MRYNDDYIYAMTCVFFLLGINMINQNNFLVYVIEYMHGNVCACVFMC